MNIIRDTAHSIFRFIVLWVVDIFSLLLTAALLPGIGFNGDPDVLVVCTAAAFLLGIVNFLIRPIILLLALPFGFIAIFLVGLVLNAITLMITAQLVPALRVDGWGSAFLGSIVLAALNTLFTGIIAVDNDDSFYQYIAERLASRENFFAADSTQGVIMMEIDGLSYHHIKKALADGWMPTLRQMMREDGYVLSRFDCGLPSQTSACQAGIMFGNNYDIPAFRWYDKDLKRLIVSGHGQDAAMINARYAKGGGLMRAGSSVNNMMNGDATLSILTLADLLEGTPEQQQRRAQDIYLIMLNPYFFLRTLVLYLEDVVREVVEGLLQQWRRQAPRLNRLAHFYPFVRAATTVLMRDVSASLTILDIVRGTPALYVTWPGYDEVAHHSGPWTRDAFRTLRQYDKVIARVRDAIDRKAPRPYELIVLSDHGQSYGWTFKQRYGETLQEFIQKHMPEDTQFSASIGGDDGIVSVSAFAGELNNMQAQKLGGRLGKRITRSAQKYAERGAAQADVKPEPVPENAPAHTPDVTVCGSGNLAQVYFDLAPRRLMLSELNKAYPGVVDALVKHEGVGIVMGYNDDGSAMVFGKMGTHNVSTNEVTGQDPLLPYGDPQLRAAQLRRLAEFPHNGDLSVISTFYPDGTVAAMEELVGNHGGVGGEQTDAFIFHPPDFTVPDTSNSADVFQVLNARRGLTVPPRLTQPMRGIDAWSPRVLWQGLLRTRKWISLALRAVLLDRWAFRAAAFDPYMTAPAVLVALLTSLLVTLISGDGFDPVEWAFRFGGWFGGALIIYGAARLLRGKAGFTTTLRAVGFAQSPFVLELVGLIHPLTTLAHAGAWIAVFFATWIAANEAQRLRGWRTFLLPVAAFVIAVISLLLFDLLLRGTQMSVTDIARILGFLPR